MGKRPEEIELSGSSLLQGVGPLPQQALDVLLEAQAALLAQDFPKQPCGETFKTRGRREFTYTPPLTLLQALAVIANAYGIAKSKAQRFCRLLSEKNCQELEFVKYDFFDSDDVPAQGGQRTASVEVVVVWRCKKD